VELPDIRSGLSPVRVHKQPAKIPNGRTGAPTLKCRINILVRGQFVPTPADDHKHRFSDAGAGVRTPDADLPGRGPPDKSQRALAGSAFFEPHDLRDVDELRDKARRLREQVAALAARTVTDEGRIPTYVAGLDDALQGGIPVGHVVGIVGPSGSMKTSLALSMMIKNRAAGTRGIYVTVEETRDSILRTMRRLGLGETEDFIVDVGRLRLEHAGAEEIRDWVRVLQDYLRRRRERGPLGLVVIDSLDALVSLGMEDARSEFFRFFHFLRSLGATTIVVAQHDSTRPEIARDLTVLADGLIELHRKGRRKAQSKVLVHVAKMRHVRHTRDYLILTLSKKNLVAQPAELRRPHRFGWADRRTRRKRTIADEAESTRKSE
jgi:KaiC/GvpD/RAD55 family RecA-like ATPase